VIKISFANPGCEPLGECAAITVGGCGRTYGLVGPGYAMAEVVADRLLGGSAAVTAADLGTSTKLKLLGGSRWAITCSSTSPTVLFIADDTGCPTAGSNPDGAAHGG